MDRAPVRRTPAPPEGHGSSWPTWRGAPLSFEGPGIVLFGATPRCSQRHPFFPGEEGQRPRFCAKGAVPG